MDTRKCVSILLPTYNERENIAPLCAELVALFSGELSRYDYEIVIIDNASTDGTRDEIRALCRENGRIRAIFNARNFGQFLSPFYGICQTRGDCTISMCADFQDPVSLLPTFIERWEEGARVVCGIKTASRENALVRAARTLYYKVIRRFSEVEQIEHFTGFGLYDRSFVDVLRSLDDPSPFLRGVVAELGFARCDVPYEQERRRAGRTSNNVASLYAAAMHSFATYTALPVRVTLIVGILLFSLSVIGGILSFVFGKELYTALSFMGALEGVHLVLLSVIAEYLLLLRAKVIKRPLVVEAERINFSA